MNATRTEVASRDRLGFGRAPMAQLPIFAIEADFRRALERGPVVVTASTGSGKSTEVPRWCPRPVTIVEPRRVACRALADRVAQLEGSKVGDKVGYVVRDDARPGSELSFVTPGIALRGLDRFLASGTFVLDEVHERTLEIDLLLALAARRTQRLVVMSATVDGQRVAEHLSATLLEAEGRLHPVDIGYDESGPTVPTADRLTERVSRAVKSLDTTDGDLLVFLPGKPEIRAVQSKLSAGKREILPLHGGMPPAEQARCFASGGRPKVILSTNVAETSVTVPGVRAVIDSGLVRQARYHQGRASLTLAAIARDSAEQRAGRAGRVAAGSCLRLWRPNAHLDARTLPEIHRLPLVPMVLAARALGEDPAQLPLLDAPKEHALETAEDELRALGALGPSGQVTERGTHLFRLPIAPWLGRVLIEAEQANLLDAAIDLTAALELTRPLFERDAEDEDPRKEGCDILALIRAVRGQGASPMARKEALEHRRRLRAAFGLPDRPPRLDAPLDRDGLRQAILRADPRSARVARPRGKRTVWGGFGPELSLDKRSAVQRVTEDAVTPLPEAIVALGIRSVTEGPKTELIATSAAPVRLQELDAAGLGEPRVGAVQLKKRRVIIEVERVFAGRVLATEETHPSGALLRDAVATLIERGRLFKGAFAETATRLESTRLCGRLVSAGMVRAYPGDEALWTGAAPTEAREWILGRLEEAGLEEEDDLSLLEADDLLPPALPEHLSAALDKDYPRKVDLGEAKYRVRYDLARRRAELILEAGNRRSAPPRSYLPRFPGLQVLIQAGGTFTPVR